MVVEAVLKIEGLTIALPVGSDRALAVEGINLSIAGGKTLCVVGESGSGKSVLANAIMGLLPKQLRLQGGLIELNGESLQSANKTRLRQLRGKTIGMVFQEPMTSLNPVMQCGSQIDEVLTTHTTWPRSQRRAEILRVLAKVRLPNPERIYSSYPHELSGGQRQRIGIAMAVILRPGLLICDEPTTALDVTTQKEVLDLIKELQTDARMAVLFITHDMSVVAEIADEVLVMRRGTAVEYGSCETVLQRPRSSYTRSLLDAVPCLTPPAATNSDDGRTMLTAVALAKNYVIRDWLGRSRETLALKDATLSLHAGQTVGIVGESGSGKSTLARCLVRLIEPSRGKIQWADEEVATLGERQLRPLRSRVQVIFQDPNRSLNPRRKVGESIIEGAINFGLSTKEAWALADQLMDQVSLPRECLQRYPAQFSGGQRQRLAIARALACRPAVLIADEAVSALDVSVQAKVLELLREIQREFSLGLLFITHDLRVAAQICDRVIVMHNGSIVEEGLTSEVYACPKHDYTRRLLEAAPAGIDAFRQAREGLKCAPHEAAGQVAADESGATVRIVDFAAQAEQALSKS